MRSVRLRPRPRQNLLTPTTVDVGTAILLGADNLDEYIPEEVRKRFFGSNNTSENVLKMSAVMARYIVDRFNDRLMDHLYGPGTEPFVSKFSTRRRS